MNHEAILMKRTVGRATGIALVLTVLLFGIHAATQASEARADYCEPSGGGTLCLWASVNLAPNTPRWFSAPGGNNLRNWIAATVGDGHGGSVTAKCVHIMRGSDGYTIQVACGSGSPGNPIPAYMRPGYLFIRHGAAGPRNLSGAGSH